MEEICSFLWCFCQNTREKEIVTVHGGGLAGPDGPPQPPLRQTPERLQEIFHAAEGENAFA